MRMPPCWRPTRGLAATNQLGPWPWSARMPQPMVGATGPRLVFVSRDGGEIGTIEAPMVRVYDPDRVLEEHRRAVLATHQPDSKQQALRLIGRIGLDGDDCHISRRWCRLSLDDDGLIGYDVVRRLKAWRSLPLFPDRRPPSALWRRRCPGRSPRPTPGPPAWPTRGRSCDCRGWRPRRCGGRHRSGPARPARRQTSAAACSHWLSVDIVALVGHRVLLRDLSAHSGPDAKLMRPHALKRRYRRPVDGYPARPVSVSANIPALPDEVFALVSDTRNDPLWCENVEKVDLIEGSRVEPGTRFRFHQHLDRPGAERMQFDVDVEVIEHRGAFDQLAGQGSVSDQGDQPGRRAPWIGITHHPGNDSHVSPTPGHGQMALSAAGPPHLREAVPRPRRLLRASHSR